MKHIKVNNNNYVHSLCLVVVCCGLVPINFITSLQASVPGSATMKNMRKWLVNWVDYMSNLLESRICNPHAKTYQITTKSWAYFMRYTVCGVYITGACGENYPKRFPYSRMSFAPHKPQPWSFAWVPLYHYVPFNPWRQVAARACGYTLWI